MSAERRTLLEVEGLEVEFRTPRGRVQAVRGLDLCVGAGEILAIVGESGSGKSVAQLAIMDLLPDSASVRARRMHWQGQELSSLSRARRRALCGRELAMVFQDPLSALHPQLTIGRQLSEVLEVHERLTRVQVRARCIAALAEVGIPSPEERLRAYPHEFSGGMRQRVMIAMALIASPRLLFADEPTTALDVTVQAQILELFRELCTRRGLAIVLVTHSLGVVARVADRVQVMYAGQALERGSAEEVLAAPAHPYTRALLRSVPDARIEGDAHPDPAAGAPARLATIPGQPPDLAQPIRGCAFAPRCERASELCRREAPRFAPNPRAACHHPEGSA
jgi:oligopeptide/dipeptide ABC transporter ATP-binding protein